MKNGFHYSGRAANLSYLNLSYPQFNHHEEAGYILIIYCCLITFALIIFAAGYLRFQENQARQTEREICSVKAFYIAQAGLQKILRGFAQNPPLDDTFDEGEYHGKTLANPSRIRVTGQYGMKDNSVVVKRTLEATVIQDIKSPFTPPALYVNDEPRFSNLPGTIDGKSSYALQSENAIHTELFGGVPIYLLSAHNPPYLRDHKLMSDDPKDNGNYYIGIENKIKEMLNAVDTSTMNTQLKQNPFIPAPKPKQYGDYDEYYSDSNNNYYCRKGGDGGWNSVELAELIVKTKCELPGGDYYLTKLELKDNATLKGKNDKPIRIICTGSVMFGNNATIIGYGVLGQQAKNFSLRCYRIGTTIEIKENCRFIGSILAPNCKLILSPRVNIIGSIVVRYLEFKITGSNNDPWLIEFDESAGLWPIEFSKTSATSSYSLTNWQELRD